MNSIGKVRVIFGLEFELGVKMSGHWIDLGLTTVIHKIKEMSMVY
jgi:hypothetical protein